MVTESASLLSSVMAVWICREACAACVATCAISRIEMTTWSDADLCCCVATDICLAESVVSSTCWTIVSNESAVRCASILPSSTFLDAFSVDMTSELEEDWISRTTRPISLVDSVTESTSEIGRVVREIQSSSSSVVMSTERASKKVDEGKVLARRTADSLGTIVSQVEETTDSAKQISIATQQQRSASEQVVVSMREMAQVATQAAQASRQIQSAITELNRLADSVVIR